MAATKENMRRYQMLIPTKLFAELEKVAHAHDVTVMDVMRQFVKLGLIVEKISESPDKELIIREPAGESKVVFIY